MTIRSAAAPQAHAPSRTTSARCVPLKNKSSGRSLRSLQAASRNFSSTLSLVAADRSASKRTVLHSEQCTCPACLQAPPRVRGRHCRRRASGTLRCAAVVCTGGDGTAMLPQIRTGFNPCALRSGGLGFGVWKPMLSVLGGRSISSGGLGSSSSSSSSSSRLVTRATSSGKGKNGQTRGSSGTPPTDVAAARKALAAVRDAKLREAVAKKHQAYNHAQQLKQPKARASASPKAPKATTSTSPQAPDRKPTAAPQVVKVKAVASPIAAEVAATHEKAAQAPELEHQAGFGTAAERDNELQEAEVKQQQQEAAKRVAVAMKVEKLKAAKATKLLVTARHYVPAERDVEPTEAQKQAEAQALEERKMHAVQAKVKGLKERKAVKTAKVAAWFAAAAAAAAEQDGRQDSQQGTDLAHSDALADMQEHEDAAMATVRLKVHRWKEAKAAKIAESAAKYAAAQEKVQQEIERQAAYARADAKQVEAARMATVRTEVQQWKEAKAEKIAKAAAWKVAVLQESQQQTELVQAKERSKAQELEAAVMAAVRVKVRDIKKAKRAKQAQQAAWLAAIMQEIEQREAEANAEAEARKETELEAQP